MNLIESVQLVKFSFVEKQPASSLKYAFVYVSDSNEYRVIKDGDRLTRSEVRKYKRRFMVNMQQQVYEYKDEVLSATRGRRFLVNLFLDLAVKDPGLLVQKGSGEIGTIIQNNLPIWVETKAREFDILDNFRFVRYIEDFYDTSPLVVMLNNMGIEIRNVRVLIKPSVRDQQHDEQVVDISRNAELKDYEHNINYERELNQAKRLSMEIKLALAEGDLLTALLIAEKNEIAKILVDRKIQQEESFRIEVQNQIKKIAFDPSIDRVEAKERLEKIKLFFPSVGVQVNSNLVSTEQDPLKGLDDIYLANQHKGE